MKEYTFSKNVFILLDTQIILRSIYNDMSKGNGLRTSYIRNHKPIGLRKRKFVRSNTPMKDTSGEGVKSKKSNEDAKVSQVIK